MIIKYKDLIKAVPSMRFLCNCDDIPFVCFPAIMGNAAIMEKELENYIACENKLKSKYCKKDENGVFICKDNRFEVIEGKEESYLKDITELNEYEVDLPVNIIDACLLKDIKIKPTYAENIKFMLNCEVK